MDEKRRKLVEQSVLFLVVSSVFIFFLFKFEGERFQLPALLIDYLFMGSFFSIGVIDPLRCLLGEANLRLKMVLFGFYCAIGFYFLLHGFRNLDGETIMLFGFAFAVWNVFSWFNKHKKTKLQQQLKHQEQPVWSTSTDMGWLWFIWSIKEEIILALYLIFYFLISQMHIGII